MVSLSLNDGLLVKFVFDQVHHRVLLRQDNRRLPSTWIQGKQACVQRAKQTHEDYESRLPRCTRYDSKASEVYKQGYFNESDGEKIQDM